MLKLPEPEVSAEQPWNDDALDRKEIAERLTNLIQNQSAPFAISLHGYWGTGKTFMLTRWQKDLEGQGFRAIYFNAWEDDFCDDPLLAIIGQLSEYFKEGTFKSTSDRVLEVALPLIRRNALSILNRMTGLELEIGPSEQRNLIDEYRQQRETKDELKGHLKDLARKVAEETEHPLVFIIDELDRCRPTFAIELLERVKHIFDVQNMVFVLGINRDELCKSLASVYGDINADVYLRRFFDFEFNLPEVDSTGFSEILMGKFGLDEAIRRLSAAPGQSFFVGVYDDYRRIIPKLMSAMTFSLRDIDYGTRLMALMVRSVSFGSYVNPFFIAILLLMKFRNPELYRSLVVGAFRTKDIMDFVDGHLRRDMIDSNLRFFFGSIRGAPVLLRR